MRMAATLSLFAGGPGSGCNPEAGQCGRKPGADTQETLEQRNQRVAQEFKDAVEKVAGSGVTVDIVPPGGDHQYDDVSGTNALATADPATNHIAFTPELLTTESIPGVAAHEVMHLRVHQFTDDHRDELPDDIQVRKMAVAAYRRPMSDYAQEVWQEVVAGKAPVMTGFQETLAEMARIEAEKGSVKGSSPDWDRLYSKVTSSENNIKPVG